ncbi:MAG TPA: hypothetical protein VK276_02635 [Rubrobacteraceae bacterium]|nr:hypothetical protein [Rubrobacteraceae bacterium]
MTAAIFVASVPPYFAVLHEACPAGLCAGGQLPPGGMRALDDLGLSIGAYAPALDLLVAIGFCAAGTFVFLRRSRERAVIRLLRARAVVQRGRPVHALRHDGHSARIFGATRRRNR